MPEGKMRNITYAQAIRTAIREEMKRDECVVLWGEDIGVYGGVYGATTGLQREFGPDRVRDTPISAMAIVGMGVGAALLGLRPVVAIMYEDFLSHAADGLVNQAAAQHSQSLEAFFCHIPGLKVVIPSNPADAKGLLKAAIRDDNPVIYFEHKALFSMKGEVPEEEYLTPIGKAKVVREGKDVTLVSYSMTMNLSVKAADMLEKEGISVELIDLRTNVVEWQDRQEFLKASAKTKISF